MTSQLQSCWEVDTDEVVVGVLKLAVALLQSRQEVVQRLCTDLSHGAVKSSK